MEPLPRRNTQAFFIILSLLFVGIGLWSKSAFADQKQKIDVRFENLTAHENGDSLDVAYEIHRQDWRALRQAGIDPKLNLYTYSSKRGSEFVTSVDLSKKSGVFSFRGFRNSGEIQVRVSGHNRRAKIGDMGFGKQCAKRIAVNVVRPIKKNKGWWAKSDRKQMNALCKKYGMSREACFSTAHDYGKSAPKTFAACGRATQWKSEFVACVKSAKALNSKHANRTIDACADATQWASEFKSCMKSLEKTIRQARSNRCSV